MFGDNRTPAERERDRKHAEQREQRNKLAMNLLKTSIKPLLEKSGANVGLVGRGTLCMPELLFEVDGVTYRIILTVDNEL